MSNAACGTPTPTTPLYCDTPNSCFIGNGFVRFSVLQNKKRSIDRRAAGVTRTSSEEQLRRLVEEAGFRPVKRDTLYRTYFLN